MNVYSTSDELKLSPRRFFLEPSKREIYFKGLGLKHPARTQLTWIILKKHQLSNSNADIQTRSL